ncbi:alpha/beta fold hydrolase [Patulibacter minatonensis]|uniref:alpha/beta fold hydrolase n=1 Tax=Patulibacter minatonensis TaxID=298163 RepID=UPI00047D8E45|nr:alpha/beta fold hydrolase [Patulibacter minatonensis]
MRQAERRARLLGPLVLAALVAPATASAATAPTTTATVPGTGTVAVAAATGREDTAPGPADRGARLRVGGLVLHRCGDRRGGWCGHVRRPLDPGAPHAARIALAVRWFAADRPSHAPPVVAVEGGPGYPSIGSSDAYRAMLGPLVRRRHLLLVDARGTGGSAPIACADLQHDPTSHTGGGYAARVGRCGASLDRRWGDSGHRVHAADLFSTADAADDLAAVLHRMRLPRIDLYGDSYGTWFAQSFAARHPGVLHAVVLDSAYPARDLDPTYAASAAAARASIERICDRDRACRATASAHPGLPATATGRLAALLHRVRLRPLRGRVRAAAGGALVPATVGPRELSDIVQDAGSDAVILRELDPAVVGALTGDPLPLLRLRAHSADADQGGSDAVDFSTGAYWAVSCTDYPALFRPASGPRTRRAQYAAALARVPRATFAPFTTAEWTTVDGVTQPYDGCLDWPRPVHARPAVPAGAPALPASVPLLVLGGDLDSLTPATEDGAVARAMARRSRIVTVQNAVHVPSEGDPSTPVAARCARRIVRAFLRDPGALERLDVRCASRTPPIHTFGAFPRRTADARPARVVAGTPSPAVRRAVTVAADAVADAMDRRAFDDGADRGPGLRGGLFVARGERHVRFRLLHDRFTDDATVDGPARWDAASGRVRARLVVRPHAARPVVVRVSWDARHPTARAVAAGARLVLPAP